MTIEGAIAGLQNLIDNKSIPIWAKPSLRAIKETVEQEMEERKAGGWNVISKRTMTAEEIDDWCEQLGYQIPSDEAFMYGNLPDEGEDVLVCTVRGHIFIDSLCRDDWCYFEDYGEMDGIVAWMPLPKPYKEVDE